MKVTVRGDRLTVDMPSLGLVIAALETAADAWLESASKPDQTPDVRKAMLKMAGEAKAMAYMIDDKKDEPDGPPAQ